MSSLLILCPSIFNDAFRTDYETDYRDSAKDIVNSCFKHKLKNNPIAYTTGEVFKKLQDTKLGKTESIKWIPEVIDIDFKTLSAPNLNLDVENSLLRLAGSKCTKNQVYLVTNKQSFQKRIIEEGYTFYVVDSKKAVNFLLDPYFYK